MVEREGDSSETKKTRTTRYLLTGMAISEGLLWPGLAQVWWLSGDSRFAGLAGVVILTEFLTVLRLSNAVLRSSKRKGGQSQLEQAGDEIADAKRPFVR